MKNVMRIMSIAMVVAGISLLNTTSSEAKKLKPSGFLDSYKGFEESEEIKGLHVKKNPSRSIRDYSKFIIDPITVYLAPRGKFSKVNPRRIGVNPKKLAELTGFFEKEIKRTLSKNYTVVDEPGEGVLRIRIAITDIQANMPIMNIHGYTSSTGIGLGSASMEGEALDSLSGEQVLAVVDKRKGKVLPKIKGQKPTGMAKEALDNKIDSLSKYKTIKQIMTNWAERFAQKVDEQHSK